MPQIIDIKTVFIFLSFISLTGCTCLVYVLKTAKTYEGFKHWTLASFLYFFSGLLAAFRNQIPDLISIVFGNVILIAAMLISLRGLCKFFDIKYPAWADILCMSIVIFSLCYFTYINQNLDFRIAVISFIIGIITTISAYIVYQHSPNQLLERNWLFIGLLGFIAFLYFFRTFYTVMIGSDTADLLKSGYSQGLFIMLLGLGYMGGYVAQIIMNYQRLGVDFQSAKNDIQILEGLIPICTNCKKIRDDEGFWNQIEAYISKRSGAKFSHSICPSCAKDLYPEMDMEGKLE